MKQNKAVQKYLLEFGNKITNLRKENHLSQEKLAELLGISIGALSKAENGKMIPKVTLLISLAILFQKDLNYFSPSSTEGELINYVNWQTN